jgi:hypothetical protein
MARPPIYWNVQLFAEPLVQADRQEKLFLNEQLYVGVADEAVQELNLVFAQIHDWPPDVATLPFAVGPYTQCRAEASPFFVFFRRKMGYSSSRKLALLYKASLSPFVSIGTDGQFPGGSPMQEFP